MFFPNRPPLSIMHKNWIPIFPYSWLITGFGTRLAQRVPLLEQELLTLMMYLSSPPLLVGFVLLYLCLTCFRLVNVIFVLRFTTSDCPFGIWNFYFLFCLFLLTIMLSVILWFTTSDCSSGIKLFFHIYVLDDQGRIQRGAHPARAPPKIVFFFYFFWVKSWFFTRNTPTIFAPPFAIGKHMIFWRKIVIFHTKYPQNFRASLRSTQFF